MIQFSEISDTSPNREMLKQLLRQEGVSGSSFQEITLVLSDESLLDLQKLLIKAYDTAYHKGYEDGEESGYETGRSSGYDDGYAAACTERD